MANKLRTTKQLINDAMMLVHWLKKLLGNDQKKTTEECQKWINSQGRPLSINSTRRSLMYARDKGHLDRKGRYWWYKNGQVGLSSQDLDTKIKGLFGPSTQLSSIEICKKLKAKNKIDKDNVRRRLTHLYEHQELERAPELKPFEYRLPRDKSNNRKEIVKALEEAASKAGELQNSIQRVVTLMEAA